MQVARLRLERDLSQKWVAKRVRCTYQYLGLIEDARANPTAVKLMGIARALGVTVVELFATTPSGEGPPPAGPLDPPPPVRRRASRGPK